MVPATLAVDVVGRDDDRALGQRLEAVLGADGDRQPAVDDVAEERDHDVLLLEGGEHLAHGLDRVEGGGHARRAADEDVVGLLVVRRPSGVTRRPTIGVGGGVAGRRDRVGRGQRARR